MRSTSLTVGLQHALSRRASKKSFDFVDDVAARRTVRCCSATCRVLAVNAVDDCSSIVIMMELRLAIFMAVVQGLRSVVYSAFLSTIAYCRRSVLGLHAGGLVVVAIQVQVQTGTRPFKGQGCGSCWLTMPLSSFGSLSHSFSSQ